MERNRKGQYTRRESGIIFEDYPVFFDNKGYPSIWLNNKNIRLHIFIWERENGKKPDGYDIHHKDFNKRNFSLENLILLSKSDHRRIHTGWIRDNSGNWTHKPCSKCCKVLPPSDFYQRKGFKSPTALCKKCHNQVEKTESQKERHREASRNYMRRKRKEKPA